MPTAKADKYLIALLELHGILPHTVAEAACKWYDLPQPVNYETAVEFVHERIHELFDSGALDDELGIEDSDGTPAIVSSPSRRTAAVAMSSGPPQWLLDAYIDAYAHWDAVTMPEPEEC